MKLVKSFILLLCITAFSQTIFAQATLSIQGIIRKSTGAAVDDGKYDLTFKLYPTTTGGTAVHTETQEVSVVGGIYSTELGGGADPLNAPFNVTYYLGVSVDGGTELIPRVRLTSSPYALSLIGSANVFPGSGPIGAGTISPSANYQLHVKSADGDAKMLVEGNTAGQIDFKKGNAVGSVGFGSASSDFVVNPGANNTALQYNGTSKLTVKTSGVDVVGALTSGSLSTGALTATSFNPDNMAISTKLAVGQTSVDANNALKVVGSTHLEGSTYIGGTATITGSTTIGGAVRIDGNSSQYYGAVKVHGGSSSLYVANPGYYDFSMTTSSRIAAQEFWAASDKRIKKDISLSNPVTDLSTLQKLRVANYRHVDEIASGSAFKKGFIAQEVEQTFPEAVTTSANFIPDVYALSTTAQLSAGKMTISLEKNHGLAIGDEVKLMLPGGEKRAIVAAVPAENSFTIDWNEAAMAEVFVYGKKVKDFHTVDYDRIFTLNVSATQELARQVEELKKQVTRLEGENSGLKTENTSMKASFETRLRALENRISN